MKEHKKKLPDHLENCSLERKKEFSSYLLNHITENRNDLMDGVLDKRTRHLTVALEDIYQPHNASAVMRSCEIFGVQELYAMEREYEFCPNNEVSMGASKWVDLYRYPKHNEEVMSTTYECLTDLKERGYQIIATSLREGCVPLEELDISKKTCLVFGTELTGLSEEGHGLADGFVQIPMHGFTQSFNISVTAALTLHTLSEKMRADQSIDWQLSDDEKAEIKFRWLYNSLASSDKILERYISEE